MCMSVFFSKTSGFHDCFAWVLYFLPQSALFTFLPQIYYGLRRKHAGVSCDLRRKSTNRTYSSTNNYRTGYNTRNNWFRLLGNQQYRDVILERREILQVSCTTIWLSTQTHFPNHGMRKWSSVTTPFLLGRTGGTGAGLLRLLSPLEPLNSKLSTFRARLCKAWQRTVTEARS